MLLHAPSRPALDSGTRRWRNAVFAIFALTGFVFANYVARIPNVRDLLHADDAQMGLLAGGIAVGSIVGLLLAGTLVARFGTVRTLAVAYTVASLGVMAAGFVAQVSPTIAGLLIGLCLLGAGHSVTDVAMNVSGAANERRIGRALMPLFHAAFSIGTVVGGGTAAISLAVDLPVGPHLIGVGVIGVVGTIVTSRFLQPAEPRPATGAVELPSTWRNRLGAWRDPHVLLIGVTLLGMAFAEGSANDWLPLAFVDGHGLSNPQGAAVFAVFVTAMTVGRIGGVPLLRRFGRVAVLRGSAGCAVVGMLVVILVPSAPIAVAGSVLWGLGAALGFPVCMSAAADDPRRAAASVSVVATIGYCAFLVGPPLIGALASVSTLLQALLLVLALVVVSGLTAGAVRARTPARRPA
ncbi:MFS transporter [uncultured Amnibacterium sp.]|uniref:MFS transporter n=1 Tax=uncultured Amnibacterium sp. TaxID=1631851 RepID=UPI0035CC790D